MIKRIEEWLSKLFRAEIQHTEQNVQKEIAALRSEVAQALGVVHMRLQDVKVHAEKIASELHENITSHATKVSDELHAKVAADARYIAKFQQTARLGCSWCGQLTRTYIIDRITGKVKCADCQKKGIE